MNNKIFILILIMVVIGSIFAYKQYDIKLQEKKELNIIEAQKNKELQVQKNSNSKKCYTEAEKYRINFEKESYSDSGRGIMYIRKESSDKYEYTYDEQDDKCYYYGTLSMKFGETLSTHHYIFEVYSNKEIAKAEKFHFMDPNMFDDGGLAARINGDRNYENFLKIYNTLFGQ